MLAYTRSLPAATENQRGGSSDSRKSRHWANTSPIKPEATAVITAVEQEYRKHEMFHREHTMAIDFQNDSCSHHYRTGVDSQLLRSLLFVSNGMHRSFATVASPEEER